MNLDDMIKSLRAEQMVLGRYKTLYEKQHKELAEAKAKIAELSKENRMLKARLKK